MMNIGQISKGKGRDCAEHAYITDKGINQIVARCQKKNWKLES